MLSPDSVSLVNPPKTTIPKTLAALPSNQYATTLSLSIGKRDLEGSKGLAVVDRKEMLKLEGPLIRFLKLGKTWAVLLIFDVK
jgi:hypothetical protein